MQENPCVSFLGMENGAASPGNQREKQLLTRLFFGCFMTQEAFRWGNPTLKNSREHRFHFAISDSLQTPNDIKNLVRFGFSLFTYDCLNIFVAQAGGSRPAVHRRGIVVLSANA